MNPLQALAAAALIGLPLLAPPSPGAPLIDSPAVTASFGQDLYELGDTIELTITGEAGAWTCILFDTQLGSYSIPGLISFDLAFSPAFTVIDTGPLPPSGQLVLSLPTDCGPPC